MVYAVCVSLSALAAIACRMRVGECVVGLRVTLVWDGLHDCIEMPMGVLNLIGGEEGGREGSARGGVMSQFQYDASD